MKPLLKWPGGKARLAPTILESMTGAGVYVDPFVGSGAMALAYKAAHPDAELWLSDINPRLVNFHQVVRDQPDYLLAALDRLPWSCSKTNAGDVEVYTSLRAEFNDPTTARIRSAALLLWLNRAGFNGLYRENSSGGFNVPCGSRKGPLGIPSGDQIMRVSAALEDANIVCCSFGQAISVAPNGSDIYCDPPYLYESGGFTSYAGKFVKDDHVWVCREVIDAADRGCRVVISGADNEITRATYADYLAGRVVFRKASAHRSIGGKGAKRGKAGELIMVVGR